MKKLFLIILGLSVFSASGQNIGVLMDSYFVERWMNDRNYICNKLDELGAECTVKVAEGNSDRQLEQAKELIYSGAKVLIIVPVDVSKAVEIVKYASLHNVKVIAYDRIIPSLQTDLYLSFDNEMVGRMQAQAAYDHVGGGNYILINGPRSDYNAILFRKGQLEVLKPYIKKNEVKILNDLVLDEWTELNAFLEMQEVVLTLDDDIDAVIAANDELASGVISAIGKDGGIESMYVTGQDAEIRAVRNLKQNLQDMTIYKPIKKLAELAAQCAVQLANGEKIEGIKRTKIAGVEINAILLKPVVVDVNNYMETIVSDGHVTIDELVSIENE